MFVSDSATEGHSLITSLDATTAAGRKVPLQDWYPFPEGYSPSFVENILEEFCPDADRVLDPFAGSGTTPLAVAMRGKTAYYCEVNPAFRELIAAKAAALASDAATRTSVAARLRRLAGSQDWFDRFDPDPDLLATYRTVFAGSVFFSEAALQQVMRARTALDRMALEDPALAPFAGVGILAGLIPASTLIRRGDLRYRRGSEVKLIREFRTEVGARLELIARDLERLGPPQRTPWLLTEDVRALRNVPMIGLDAVVTSPPYLNGTNYARNSRLELWFLRVLREQGDLRRLRDRYVTSGINDVRSAEGVPAPDLPRRVRDVVDALAARGYDARLPRLASAYFADLRDAFTAVGAQLRTGARLIVDIGDSIFAGVHIATDDLLVEVLVDIGFTLDHRVTLRQRRSRSGALLRQSLLVLSWPIRKPMRQEPALPHPGAWDSFKTERAAAIGSHSKRNWGNPLHSLCSYGGKLKPSIAAGLVSSFVPSGGRVLDPFSGVGTIPFEAALVGAEAFALDLSPAAWHVTRAKIDPPSRDEAMEVLGELAAEIASAELLSPDLNDARSVRFNGPIADYFHEDTLRELLIARSYFRGLQKPTRAQSFILACLLHVLHGNRPYALSRRSHPITPFQPSGEFEYKSVIEKVGQKAERSLAAVPEELTRGHAFLADSTAAWPASVDRLDAVITSPPFFDSTRFYLSNWMRMWFAGWEAADFGREPARFVETKQRASFDVYEPVFRQARERLKPGGLVVLHLGSSRKANMAESLASVAQPWFAVLDSFSEDVRLIEHHGIRDKGTVHTHQYLVLG